MRTKQDYCHIPSSSKKQDYCTLPANHEGPHTWAAHLYDKKKNKP